MTVQRICLLYADRPAERDGIRDFSDGLVRALDGLDGVEARLTFWRSSAWRATARDATAVVVQYNPFSYGRWGFAPALVADLRRLRKQRVSVMVHEPYVPIKDWRSLLMGGWQRFQLRGLLALADGIGLSTESFRSHLPRRHRARAAHLPVGSPLSDARGLRSELRTRIGAGKDQLVIAVYGSAHPSRLPGHCTAAVERLVDEGRDPIVLNLGADAPELSGLPPRVRVRRPGLLPAAELGAWLAAADLALLPFVDGASTRRTTLIAALQQEVCVLSTDGPLTDRELAAGPAPVLTPVESQAAFADAAAALAADDVQRSAAAAEGRRLYDERFAWPVVAERLVAMLQRSAAR
jgi:glycosyltransferase involved in cell wall biosynthesis